MSTKTLDIPAASEEPAVIHIEARGVKYTFTEMEISDYDAQVKKASHDEADENGVMQEITDNALLIRLMILKSCTSPKLTAEALNRMGTRLYRSLARVVNELHFDPEPIKVIADDETPEEAPKGNAG